ncbi:MAG: (2Fe-2S) ferredoxin domain-containing protein [Firmicutes bacterium]|nr:(2Fe-2S) ferredoxin domain-containing protein [Bacillota bacterium]
MENAGNGNKKLRSWDDLKKLRAGEMAKNGEKRTVLLVGMATCGVAAGARDVSEALAAEIKKQGLKNIDITATGCYGFCYAEPMVEVRVPGKNAVRYGHVDKDLAGEIVRRHLMRGEVLDKYVLTQEVTRP